MASKYSIIYGIEMKKYINDINILSNLFNIMKIISMCVPINNDYNSNVSNRYIDNISMIMADIDIQYDDLLKVMKKKMTKYLY